MTEYSPPKFPRGTIFNQGDFLYLYQPLKYITNIGVGSKVYKETYEGTARLRTITSSHMTIAQNANEIDIANSGKFFAVNGTNTAPSYSFSNDLNTGLHRPSADTLHMVCGGMDVLQLDNVNGVYVANGYNIYGTGRFTAQQQGTAASPIFRTDLGGSFHGMYFDSKTGAPTIASSNSDIAEFSSTDITLYKTLSSGVQPYSSYLRNTDQTGLTGAIVNTILYDTKEQEYSNRITFASGVYTVLDAGVYHIHADLQISSSGPNFDLSSFFTINGSATDRVGYIVTRTQAVHLISISNVIRLSANDTVRVQIIPGVNATLNTTANGTRKLRFSIVRLF